MLSRYAIIPGLAAWGVMSARWRIEGGVDCSSFLQMCLMFNKLAGIVCRQLEEFILIQDEPVNVAYRTLFIL